MSKFKKYYEFPIRTDEYGSYAWSKNNTMALMFNSKVNRGDRQKIVDAINGKTENKIENIKHTNHNFFDGDEYIFCVRGWGFLTGIGGCNLPSEKAIKIQDEFIEHIYNSLKL